MHVEHVKAEDVHMLREAGELADQDHDHDQALRHCGGQAHEVDGEGGQLRVARQLKGARRHVEQGDGGGEYSPVHRHPAEGQRTVAVADPVVEQRGRAQARDEGGDEDIDLLFSVVPASEELFYPVYPLRVHG